MISTTATLGGKWLVWDGKRWRADDGGKVVRLAKATARAMYHEAASGERIDKDLSEHARKSESATRLKGMLELAKSEEPVLPEDLDYNPYLLNCQNGTVELKTGA